MDYLADTVTIIRQFSKSGSIGKEARNILAGTDIGKHRIYISVLSLAEIMYLSQKNRIAIDLAETIRIINASDNYRIVDLTPDIVTIADKLDFYELFDRMIIATAKFLDIPLISPDEAIRQSNLIPVIWK
ncbi:MAG: PIN domain-containing protein [Desulfuromonadales bacterium]|nr:PIN domain-containing protein [Desulfuromonadales bacterium]